MLHGTSGKEILLNQTRYEPRGVCGDVGRNEDGDNGTDVSIMMMSRREREGERDG